MVIRPLARWSMTLRLNASRSAIFSDAASTMTSARRRFSASWPARNATAKKAKTLAPTVMRATSAGGTGAPSGPSSEPVAVYCATTMAIRQKLANAAMRRLP